MFVFLICISENAKMGNKDVETFSLSQKTSVGKSGVRQCRCGCVCAALIMAQSEPSIRDRLDQIDSDIDSSHRRKLRKINTRFPDLPDKLVLVGSDGRVQRMPKEAETKVKEELKY